MRAIILTIDAGGAIIPSPASSHDTAFEVWLNPEISHEFDSDTELERETAQRFRNGADGRVDTYFVRTRLHQDVSAQFTLSGAFERRTNDGGRDETRVMQQLSARHGSLRTRLRLEQRLVNDTDRMGLRLRPRLGFAMPLDIEGRWLANADAELILTVRNTDRGGDNGITGLRTQIGASYDFNEHVSLGLTYLRQQAFERDGPDEVAHAPLVTVELAL